MIRLIAIVSILAACCAGARAETPFLKGELIFPLEHWHNHASSIVELPNGDLFVCWYHGSGERQADDVIVQGAYRRGGASDWEPRFTLADTPNFPDSNPAMLIDSRQRLWLVWPVILANEWHTALLKYRISTDYQGSRPQWDFSDNLLFVPRNFEAKVREMYEPILKSATATEQKSYLQEILRRAGDKYFRRLGWMTRAHPLELPSGRILVPLYSDGFDFSLIVISDDGGLTWTASEPLVAWGAVQPTLVRRRDGTLVAYMRDNGPAPKRVHQSASPDEGETWTPVVDTDIPNPGSGLEAIVLREGLWVMIYNDTERGRHSLAVALSDDEGRSWKWKRHLELAAPGKGSFHYPSIIQGRDGSLHASFSYFVPNPTGAKEPAEVKSIKHAHFNIEWIQQGDQ